MTKLTTFQRTQLYLSVIPFFSTFFILITTMVELKKKKTSWVGWLCFFLIMAIALFLYTGVSTVLSYEEFPIGNSIFAWIIFAIANIALVFLQLFPHKSASKSISQNHKKAVIIVISVLVFITAGVVVINNYISAPSHIEDINGPATNLGIITMEEIYTTRNAGTATMGGDGGYGDKSMVDGDYAIFDYDNYSLKWKKISGIFTLQATKVETDILTLSVDSILTSGNAEILIFINDEYYKHIPIGQEQQIVLENISEKTVVVKLAAESAEIELSIDRY